MHWHSIELAGFIGAAWAVPPRVGWGDLPTCRLAGAGKGALTRPFTIPGLGGGRLPGKLRAAGRAPPAGRDTPSLAWCIFPRMAIAQ